MFLARPNIDIYLRHESSGESLEEECNGSGSSGKVRAESRTHGQETSEESNGSKEESDQIEGEHESREVVELVAMGEGSRKSLSGSEVATRVKGKCRHGFAAVCIEAICFTANLEESPSRRVASCTCAAGIGLKEVRLVEGRDVNDSREDDEECKQDACCEDNERCEREDGAWKSRQEPFDRQNVFMHIIHTCDGHYETRMAGLSR